LCDLRIASILTIGIRLIHLLTGKRLIGFSFITN
jgi:hypothetical protein